MIVTTELKPTFQPIKLVVEIETPEELTAILKISGNNVTIASHIAKKSDTMTQIQEDLISDILAKIFWELQTKNNANSN